MNRVLLVQTVLIIAIFAAGLQTGLNLSEISRSEATWLKLLPVAFAAIAMAAVLILSIVAPERFISRKD